MKATKYIAVLLIAVLGIGCEDVVDVDLNTSAPRLVIDASLDWIKGTDGSTQTVKLTTTTGFYVPEVPVVSGAVVQVQNSSDVIFDFIENAGTGEYICTNFIPVIGETYMLTVTVGDQVYTATETLIGAPEIGEIEQDSDTGLGDDVIQIKFFFLDNGAEDNYYMTGLESEVFAFPAYDVFDDEFFQGNETFGLYLSEDLEAGDQTFLSLYGISERFSNYMNILLETSEGGGGPWSSPLTNVRGNLINQTNFDNFALGYFRLSEVDRVEYIVQEPN